MPRTSQVSEREKHEKELHELQDGNALGRFSYRPAEVHEDVVVAATDSVDKVGEVHASGGYVFVKVDGKFKKDDLVTFQQTLASAFQAVS